MKIITITQAKKMYDNMLDKNSRPIDVMGKQHKLSYAYEKLEEDAYDRGFDNFCHGLERDGYVISDL